jgi:hypothetical protein
MRRMTVMSLMLVGCSAPLRSGPPEATTAPSPQAAAARNPGLALEALDKLIEARWQAAGVTPAPPAQEGEFLRRVTLDLIGRIPTLAEAKAYLADEKPDRRARVVDRLLGSHEFAEHWGDVYGDLLFGTEGKAAKLERQYDPASWLVKAFAENRPYDRIAYDLLTATGDVRDSGAVGFIVARSRGGGGPEAVAGATARIFLGLQIQCAQCHDHPYDTRWKQEDFYGLVAYFARTKVRNENVDKAGMMVAMNDGGKAGGSMDMQGGMASSIPTLPPGKGKAQKTLLVLDVRRGEAKMRKPHSEEEIPVGPRFLGHELREQPNQSRREALARAVLGSDLFAKSMVARTWSQLFGHGIVDPWDDLGGERDAKHPPLLVDLAQGFADSGYDFKRLLRTIVLSTAYARSGAGPDDNDAGVRNFSRAGVRPLGPETLFASLLAATGTGQMGGKRAEPERIARRIAAAAKEYQFVFGDDEMLEANRFDGSVPQSLLLLNGELTNNGSRADTGGVLAGILESNGKPATRLDDMFLAVYTRRPSAEEREPLLEYVRDRRNARQAYEDIYFALLTSTEAITNH